MFLRYCPFIFGLITCLSSVVRVSADDTVASGPTDVASGVTLQPSRDITLMVGEAVELTLLEGHSGRDADASAVDWTVDERPISQMDAAEGTLTPSAGNKLSAAYIAPAKLPAKRTVSIVATLSGSVISSGQRYSITLTDEPNWFELDGDTGIGHVVKAIQLDPKIRSAAGFGVIPLGTDRSSFVVHIVGMRKGDATEQIIVDLSLGPNSQPGTFPWHLKKPFIGAVVTLPSLLKGYSSIDLGSKIMSLDGSTTILKPAATDAPGLVKGFYAGRLRWGEHQGTKVTTHYLSVRGHFTVPVAG